MSEITLKLTIDGKEGLAVLKLTDAELLQIANDVKKVSSETKVTGSKMVQSFADIKFSIEGIRAAYSAVQQAIAKPLQLYADMEQAGVSFEVLLGDAEKAKKLLQDIRDFGATTPLEFVDLQKGAQTLLAFGTAGSEIMPTLKMLGDVSMGDANKLQQITLAYAQIQSTGRLMGQDLLQLINGGFNPLKIISEQTGKSMGQLKKDMEAGSISSDMVKDAFKRATSEGGMFYDMLNKQSKTVGGAISNLSDNATQVQIDTGKVLAVAIVPLINHINNLITKLHEVSPELIGIAGVLGTVGTATIGLNAFGLLPMIINTKKVGVEMRYASGIMKVAAAEGMAAEGAMMAASTATKGFFAALGPIGWAIIGLTTIATVWSLIESNTEKAIVSSKEYLENSTKGISEYTKAQAEDQKKATEELIAQNKKLITENEKAHDEALTKRINKDKDGNEYELKYETETSKFYTLQAEQLKNTNKEYEKKLGLLNDQIEVQAKLNKNTEPDGVLGKINKEIDALEKKKPFAKSIDDLVIIEKKIAALTSKKKIIELEISEKINPAKKTDPTVFGEQQVQSFQEGFGFSDSRSNKRAAQFKNEKVDLPADEAEQKKIALIDNEYERQRALADFEYQTNVKKYGDLEILAQEHSNKIRQIDSAESQAKLQGMCTVLNAIAGVVGKYTAVGKVIAMYNIGLSIEEGIAKAWALGGPLGWIGAGVVAAAGAIIMGRVATMEPPKVPGFKDGGIAKNSIAVGENGIEIISPMQSYAEGQALLVAKTILAVDNNLRNMQMRSVNNGNGGDFSKVEKVMTNFVGEIKQWQRGIEFKFGIEEMYAAMKVATAKMGPYEPQ